MKANDQGLAYYRISSGFDEHEKIERLSDGAFRSLFRLFGYCARRMSDGVVLSRVWSRLVPDEVHQSELVALGIVDKRGYDYEIHGWLEWQESKASIEAKREAFRNRKNRSRGVTVSPNSADVTRDNMRDTQRESRRESHCVEVEVEERERKNPSGSKESAGAANQKVARIKKPSTPCPASTSPETELEAFSERWKLDRSHVEFARFLDHHTAKCNRFADWSAAWRTWQSNAIKFAPRFGPKAVDDDRRSEVKAFDEKVSKNSLELVERLRKSRDGS